MDIHDQFMSPFKKELVLKFTQPGMIIDLGSGACQYAYFLTKNFLGSFVTAVDFVDYIPEPPLLYIKADLEKTFPFPSMGYDTVCAFDILEHITAENCFLKEVKRILKPGGVFIGSVPHDDDGFLPQYNLTFKHRSDLTHKRYYTKMRLEALLEEHNFSIVEVCPQGVVSPHVIAEFFPMSLRWIVKKIVGLLRRIGLIRCNLRSDLFFVAIQK